MSAPDVVTVLVSRADGGVTIMRVITTERGPDGVHWTIDPTPDYIEAIIAKHNWQGGQAAVSWEFAPNDIVGELTDRTFRNAWKANSRRIEVDMPKAREIHRANLRLLRTPMLEVLDTEYLRADESGDQQAKRQIAARKQALRDMPADPAIDSAQTPEELKAVLPEALRG